MMATRRERRNHGDQVWRGGSLGLKRAVMNLADQADRELLELFVE